MRANAVARQHGADPARDLGNFGKLHLASVWDGLEFKPCLAGAVVKRPIATEECCMEPKP